MPSSLSKTFASQQPDVLGIYGQNGSGKTAVIEAMSFIQRLLKGEKLRPDTQHYISKEQGTCVITASFDISAEGRNLRVEYRVELKRVGDDNFIIESESLSAKIWNGEKFNKKKLLLKFSDVTEGTAFEPNYRFDDLVKDNDKNELNLGVAVLLALKEHRSFIFNEESRKVFFSASKSVTSEYAFLIHVLYRYARYNLFVITNQNAGLISLNLLPISYRLETEDTIERGYLPIRLSEPSLVDQKRYDLILQIIPQLNGVLCQLIPDITLGVYNIGEQLLKNGTVGHKIQLISIRGNVKIPLKYESEGIIKIISILNALMYVFNNPSSCLLIDELDSGIFEYLLGEVLLFFSKNAKGQLVFTSHNLRALEILPKAGVLFSTANPKNRYIRLRDVKKNNNLRDFYLRSIKLGGQSEDIYAETDTTEIGRAFRRAGKVVQNGEDN
ncbi:MAG: ATP-binding protein [Clostridiales bacterium]|nr:ATP-binding protein [Clostridiales bacterium]